MSSLKLSERFTLESPPDVVWRYLVDPVRTVECLPGAQITAQEDERTYAGTVKVRVGAVKVTYAGTIVFEEVDEAARRVRIVGKGLESTGSGSAELSMQSRVTALEGGVTEVTVDADVRLTGRIIRFGRGMIETISAEIFKEFRERLADALARESAEAPGAAAPPMRDAEAPGPGVARPWESPTGTFVMADATPEDDSLPLLDLLRRALRSWVARLFRRR